MNSHEALQLTKQAQIKAIEVFDDTIAMMARNGHRYATLRLSGYEEHLTKQLIDKYTLEGFKITLHGNEILELNW
jgi:hypothetical protein